MCSTMRTSHFLFSCLLTGFTSLFGSLTFAQIIPDQTLGNEASTVTSDVKVRGAPAELIEGGAIRGTNLFHSFSDFNILESERAYFSNPVGVESILSRVTGDSGSNIFGTLGVEGTSDLFFINPNGIVFGQSASLDVSGSFIGTTASGIQFGDQGLFDADDSSAPSNLLTIAPSALLFDMSLLAPGRILVEGDGQGARTTTNLIDSPTGLSVSNGQTLALIGGDLVLNGATLKTAGGRIELGSVESDEAIGIKPVVSGWTFNYSNVQDFRNIQLAQQATIDASGLGGGDIHLQGREIILQEDSQIEASTLGSQPGGNIDIKASDAVSITNSGTDNFITGIYAQVYTGSSGSGGNINITADRVKLAGDVVSVDTNTFGSGEGGDLTIQASDVEVVSNNQIGSLVRLSTDTNGRDGGQGGNLTINTQRLRVSRAQVSASTLGVGDAGNLSIRSRDFVEVSGEIPGGSDGFPGGLFAVVNFGATGQGGNLNIATSQLSVSDGSKVQAISFGNGDAGNVVIEAEQVAVFETAEPNFYFTGIFTGTGIDPRNVELPKGNGGSLTINAGEVSVRGGKIAADTGGQGNAGSLFIQARDLVEVIDTSLETRRSSSITTNVGLRATGRGGDLTIQTPILTVLGSPISASTSGRGNAGSLTVRADSVELSGENPIIRNGLRIPSGLLAQVNSSGTGRGGNLLVEADRLSINDGSKVQAISSGEGDAGNISLTVRDRLTARDGTIGTNSESGTGGRIQIDGGVVILRADSDIQAFINRGENSGGSITIESDAVVALEDSDILAFSPDGQGGTINLSRTTLFSRELNLNAGELKRSDLLILDGNAEVDINATGGTQAGSISVNNSNLVDNNLTQLADNLVETEVLIVNSCIARGANEVSTLVLYGRDRLPQSPTQPLPNNFSSGTVRSIVPSAATQPATIEEPQAVYRSADGRFVMSQECDR